MSQKMADGTDRKQFLSVDDEFRNYYRIICESCISEVVLDYV